jgi:two-component system response regulator FlrC
MADVTIIEAGLSCTDVLAGLAQHRGMACQRLDAKALAEKELKPSQALICSRKFYAKLKTPEALLDYARKLKAKKVIVIDEQKPRFSVSSELAGRLINVDLASGQSEAYGFEAVISLIAQQKHMAVGAQSSSAMYSLAQRVARSDVTVFINGPTGTGKEVLAKFVHLNSTRAENPFVAVNCAAIPENMLEAILFGHEKGSFTGASTANKGIFRAADGGTLLLDEISEMPMSLQAKLLRALQEKTVTPIGGHEDIPVDVRVLATTNRDMPKAIREGAFREDLYYRLNVFPLTTLPLAARPEDIIPIASALLVRHCDGRLDSLPDMSDAALKALIGYDWPGNVRELENVLQRALVLCQDNIIQVQDIITDMHVGNLYHSHAQPQPNLAAVNS